MCGLYAYGKKFDVDRFLRHCPWKVSVTYRGEVFRDRKAAQNSLSMIVSNDPTMELAPQICDATKFIKKNKAQLRRLGRCAGLEGMELDFLLEGRLNPKIAAYEERFPAEFVKLAGEVGLSLVLTICAVYPPSKKITKSRRLS